MTQLEGHDLCIGYPHHMIIEHLNIKFPDQQIIGLIGPNGSGKSTLLNVLSGFRQPAAGTVMLNQQPLNRFRPKIRAQNIASLPQNPQAPADTLVRDLVAYGRFAYQKPLHGLQAADEAAIDQALTAANLEGLATRSLANLSGGQRQRAFIAMTLAQNSDILLLDEPTTYLDLTHQLEILKLLQTLNQTQHKTIIIVLHDLNQAARFCDFLVCLKAGQVMYQGRPDQIFTARMLAKVFQIDATVALEPRLNCPMITSYDTLATAATAMEV
ncbi:ABC transporter ATP-binding protein [Loigolactobacillus binensis]|uniref:ABC transporter ATP-binding protein n=1 Tax=Loigolactobacillus binensis TaxID=2559922 RepID=A0ABW3EAV2_9LACO|nr:ABC transporter ATP-binding protein [Loigolactobacillus binensis]